MRYVLLVLLTMMVAACSTVTITPEGQPKISTEPTYKDRKPFFLFGVIGEHDVDVKQVCGERKVRQMQTEDTFMDSFLKVVTIGIYAPRTAKVWCQPAAGGQS